MTGIITQNTTRDSGLIKATAGASNAPFFFARRGASGCSGDACNNNFSDNSYVKAPFNNEVVDSDSCYDVSSYRFTPNVAGDYFFFCQTDVGGGTVDRLNQIYVDLRKNGTITHGAYYSGNDQSSGYDRDYRYLANINAIVTMNGSSDYVEIYMKADESSSTPWFFGGTSGGYGNYNGSFFGGYKLA